MHRHSNTFSFSGINAYNVWGIFGFGKMVEVGMTLEANANTGMDFIEFGKYLSRPSFRCLLMHHKHQVNV